MEKIKYTLDQYLNDECTRSEYRQQFSIVKLKLNKIYVQHRGAWNEKHFLIIAIDQNTAFAKCVFNKISNEFIGDYELFNVDDGWKYQDIRKEYRLEEK